jgi:CO/xanthine dehydrogenase Mo-binding subunit
MRRIDGADRVSGALMFIEDMNLPDLAHAKLVLSYVPSATIKAIHADRAMQVPGVLAVITGVQLGLEADGPEGPMAVKRVHFSGQPVAAVVATTPAAAADAAAYVEVEYEQLPDAVDVESALRDNAPRVMPQSATESDEASAHGAATSDEVQLPAPVGNITGWIRVKRGDVDKAFAEASTTDQRTYSIAAVHHSFLETHGVTASYGRDGSMTVWTPTQGMSWVREAVAKSLNLPHSQVRVVPMPVGGGFGGKITQLEPLAAHLSRTTGRPVRLVLSRSEEFLVGFPAPGATISLQLGATKDGDLTAMRADVVYDNGSMSGWHGGISAELMSSTYRVPNLEIGGKEVATNKVPTTAYRAPGAPQAYFALESSMDEMARALGLDPLAFRLRNAARPGDLRGGGTAWPQIGLVECLEAAARHAAYRDPKPEGEGLGVAVGAWIGAFGAAAAACRVEADGSISLHLGTSDISGTDSGFTALAAETFGTTIERIRVYRTDSTTSPVSPIAGGSATTYSVAPAVVNAVLEARRQVLEIAGNQLEAAIDDLEVVDGAVGVRGVPGRSVTLVDIVKKAEAAGGQGPIHTIGRVSVNDAAPMFTVHVARVRVDRETGAVRVIRYAAFQDVGHAITPDLIRDQIHGGLMQGLGRALGEELVWDGSGQLRTGSFADYSIPSADLAPDLVEVELVQVPSEHGAFGARGVGEPPAVPGLAAIANAIRDATGLRLTSAPFTLEAVSSLRHSPGNGAS